MSVASASVRGTSPSSSPTVYNITSPGTPNTEFSQVLNPNTKKFMIRSRLGSIIQIAFNSGESGSNYFTLPKYTVLEQTDLQANNLTLYMQVNRPTDIIEIMEWT